MRRPIGLTVPYREVGYKEKKEWEIKRPWVGLTIDEVDEAARYCVKSGQSVNAAIRAIEAKLKEKNA